MTTVQSPSRELVKGREYRIEFYPSGERVNAVYLGKVKDTLGINSIFSNDKSYIFVNNSWMNQERGIITNTSMSSSNMLSIDKEKLRVSSRLIKMLENMGETI